MNKLVLTSVLTAVALLCGGSSLAAGPFDFEVGAVWWANNFDSSGGVAALDSDAAAPGFRAEAWLFRKYGMRAGMYNSEIDDLTVGEDTEYTSIDLLWRPYSLTEESFVAVGLGYQEMDLASIGLNGDTSGPRMSAEARFGFGLGYVYGQLSYLPELDDAMAINPVNGRFVDMTALEYEAGVSWKFAPFMALRGGYRFHSVDFTRTDFGPPGTRVNGEAESEGFLAGLTLHF